MKRTLILTLCAASISVVAQDTRSKTNIFIEQKIGQAANTRCDGYGGCNTRSGEVDYSLKATTALLDRCPDIINVTTDVNSADFILRLQTGNSVLFKTGNAVYASHASRKLSNFAKDICGYVKEHPAH